MVGFTKKIFKEVGTRFDPYEGLRAGSHPAGIVALFFVKNCIGWLLFLVIAIALFVLILGVGLILNVFLVPAGYYASLENDKFLRVPYWPKVFGRNVWLWVGAPIAWRAHYGNNQSWFASGGLGIVCAFLVPLLWYFATVPVSVEQKPE